MLSNLTGYFYDSGHYKEAIELETYTLNLIDSAMGKNNAQYALALGCLATFIQIPVSLKGIESIGRSIAN